jgi:hypothetical protein
MKLNQFVCLSIEVFETSLLIRSFKPWHLFTHIKNYSQRIEKKYKIFNYQFTCKNTFNKWKSLMPNVLSNIQLALDHLKKRNNALTKKIFETLRYFNKSKKISNVHIAKYFRYKPTKVFEPIHHYYEMKRSNYIKALNFSFKKTLPKFISQWKLFIEEQRIENKKKRKLKRSMYKIIFLHWHKEYQSQILYKIHNSVRFIGAKRSLNFLKNLETYSLNLNSSIQQYHKESKILKKKIKKVDEFSKVHADAVIKRYKGLKDIDNTLEVFFIKNEEAQLIDNRLKNSIIRPDIDNMRKKIGQPFLNLLNRTVKNASAVMIHEVAIQAFRIMKKPLLLKRARIHFEKHRLNYFVKTALKYKSIFQKIHTGTRVYHSLFGWDKWRRYMENANVGRSPELLRVIRRRCELLCLYPFFGFKEILPINRLIPIQDIPTIYKDISSESLQKKISEEKSRHIEVKIMLGQKEMLRNFLRAYVSYVQEVKLTNEVIQRIQKIQQYRKMRIGFDSFFENWRKEPHCSKLCQKEVNEQTNINALFVHFVKTRNKQHRLLMKVSVTKLLK